MKYLLLFLAVPALILSLNNQHFGVRAEEDDVEDDMVDVEGEETAVTGEDVVEEEEAPAEPGQGGSPDAQTMILFTKPVVTPGSPLELPGGILVEFLVGFKNNGPQDFVLETLDASFRYPMDFNFYIQNFSTLAYERTVKPTQEATLFYSFVPAEAFAGRPFGLSINLRYRDVVFANTRESTFVKPQRLLQWMVPLNNTSWQVIDGYPLSADWSGNQFYEGVYNETVNIVELDEGLDGETFFLYVFLGACAVLLLVLGQHLLVSVGKKRVGSSTSSKRQVETGTNDRDDVDYDWLPKETLQSLNKSPKPTKTNSKSPKTSPKSTPKTSPKPRRVKAD